MHKYCHMHCNFMTNLNNSSRSTSRFNFYEMQQRSTTQSIIRIDQGILLNERNLDLPNSVSILHVPFLGQKLCLHVSHTINLQLPHSLGCMFLLVVLLTTVP